MPTIYSCLHCRFSLTISFTLAISLPRRSLRTTILRPCMSTLTTIYSTAQATSAALVDTLNRLAASIARSVKPVFKRPTTTAYGSTIVWDETITSTSTFSSYHALSFFSMVLVLGIPYSTRICKIGLSHQLLRAEASLRSDGAQD